MLSKHWTNDKPKIKVIIKIIKWIQNHLAFLFNFDDEIDYPTLTFISHDIQGYTNVSFKNKFLLIEQDNV